jgi:hypothetical protein
MKQHGSHHYLESTRKEIVMAENTSTAKLVEVGLNKYGQRLDEYNEFGQSLEAETWHFDALAGVSVAPLPPLERLIRPARAKELVITEDTNTAKPVTVGVNRYGQRLDEYNEFGQSLEAEAWHFDALAEVSVAPLPPLERLIRPARNKNRAAAGNGSSPVETHRRAA